MRRDLLGTIVALALSLACAPPAGAQPSTAEELLRERFEGRWVRVRIDMPAHEKGVDIRPEERPVLDYSELAKRLKRYGTAVRRDEEIQVTRIKVKKDLVEFQLGGGGYGTFGDDTDTDASVGAVAKSQREKNLEAEIKRTSDPARRRALQEEADALRREREREDARNRAIAAAASEQKKENLRARAAGSGSRFNVRFRGPVPPSALEPAGLMRALGEYVVFDVDDRDPGADAVKGMPPAPEPPRGVAALRKGMSRADAEAILGPPSTVTPGREGTLRVERLVFTTASEEVDALVVEGVVVRYSVSSK